MSDEKNLGELLQNWKDTLEDWRSWDKPERWIAECLEAHNKVLTALLGRVGALESTLETVLITGGLGGMA